MERTTERLARCAYIARTTFPGVLLALGVSSCDRDAPTAAGRSVLARDSAWVAHVAGLAGQKLVVIEAMKMEQGLVAPFDGVVAELQATAGSQVSEGALLVRIEKQSV